MIFVQQKEAPFRQKFPWSACLVSVLYVARLVCTKKMPTAEMLYIHLRNPSNRPVSCVVLIGCKKKKKGVNEIEPRMKSDEVKSQGKEMEIIGIKKPPSPDRR